MYCLFLGKALIFRRWLHYHFLSRRINSNPQDNIALCWQLVFFGRLFLLQLNRFPDWVHHRAAQTHVLAQHWRQRRSGNE